MIPEIYLKDITSNNGKDIYIYNKNSLHHYYNGRVLQEHPKSNKQKKKFWYSHMIKYHTTIKIQCPNSSKNCYYLLNADKMAGTLPT